MEDNKKNNGFSLTRNKNLLYSYKSHLDAYMEASLAEPSTVNKYPGSKYKYVTYENIQYQNHLSDSDVDFERRIVKLSFHPRKNVLNIAAGGNLLMFAKD